MPRNRSEKHGLPSKFPLPGAPHQHLPPKFHERIFWNMGVAMLTGDGDLQRHVGNNYEAVHVSFSPEEGNRYVNLGEDRVPISEYYRRWWVEFRCNHAA